MGDLGLVDDLSPSVVPTMTAPVHHRTVTRAEGFGLIRQYDELGWTLTPVMKGGKKPVNDAWTSAAPPSEDDLERWFGNGAYNPGLRLGAVSNNVHDLDCDDEALKPYLAALAPDWAEKCPGWGRGPRPHVLVRPDATIPYRKFTHGQATLLEIRGNGHQSVVPPGVHASGEAYVWARGPFQPPEVLASEVVQWAEDAVVAFALGEVWSEGSRHEMALGFGGFAARRNVEQDRVERIIRVVADLNRDMEVEDRLRAVADSYARVEADEPATGWPTLARLVGERSSATLRTAWKRTDGDNEERVGKYLARGNQFFVEKGDRRGNVDWVELTNFDLRVVREVSRSDGSEIDEKLFHLAGRSSSGRGLACIVPASEFAAMNWVVPRLGTGAVVSAGHGAKEGAREAIQRFSGQPPEEVVYTHTGWRKVENRWVYLHAGLGGDVSVDLEGPLARYALPVQPVPLVECLPASLRLLDLSESPVVVALWSAVFLAPLAPFLSPDLTVWLWGPSGSFKSTIAALFLCHYGEFERDSLTADWSSTENFLERQAFLAKDALFVIDEYAPGGTRTETERQIAKASRIIRAQGNHSGRGRMRSDTSLRPAMPPRGVLLSTAESPPQVSASALARTLQLELRNAAIDVAKLTISQREASLLRSVMAHYVAWVGEHYEELATGLPVALDAARDSFRNDGHRRTPEALARLEVAAATAVQFMVESNAIQPSVGRDVMATVSSGLRELGAAQDLAIKEADPARGFMQYLSEAMARGSGFLADLAGGEPPGAEGLGWESQSFWDAERGKEARLVPPRTGLKFGWADDEFLYLSPKTAFGMADRMAREAGTQLGATPASLAEALRNKGWLVPDGGKEGRQQARVRAENKQLRVWKLHREALDEWSR